MNYYGTSYWAPTNSLSHHGILGQKWGKKNGPPYPLGSSDHSASEKKAGWRKSLNTKELNAKNRPSHKDISKERFNIGIEKAKNLRESDSELMEMQKQIDAFDKKYGLDQFESADSADDAFYELKEKSYNDKKLESEIEQYEELQDKYAKKCSEYYSEGQKYADSVILSKYGKMATTDTYVNEKAKVAVLVIGGIILSPIIIPVALATAAIGSAINKKDRKKNN